METYFETRPHYYYVGLMFFVFGTLCALNIETLEIIGFSIGCFSVVFIGAITLTKFYLNSDGIYKRYVMLRPIGFPDLKWAIADVKSVEIIEFEAHDPYYFITFKFYKAKGIFSQMQTGFKLTFSEDVDVVKEYCTKYSIEITEKKRKHGVK
jgi:hypothetical protein